MKIGSGRSFSVLVLAFCFAARVQIAGPLDAWTSTNIGAPMELRGLAYQDGRFVGVAVNTNVLFSSNGINWVKIPAVTNCCGLLSVAAGAGQFVAVGAGPGALVMTSSDGLQWTQRFTGFQAVWHELWGVTYGGGRFVAAGFDNNGYAIASISTAGAQWQSVQLPIRTTIRGIGYGKGVYVAAGFPISMMSSNGTDWTALDSVSGNGVAFGAGLFVTSASTNGFRSSNGVDWTQFRLPGEGAEQAYYTARYANGMFLVAGLGNQSPAGLLATSTDGIQWTPRNFGPPRPAVVVVRDIVHVDGVFYLADQTGKIWKSGVMPPASQQRITQVDHATERTTITITAEPGFHYRLECKDRLEAAPWTNCGGRLFADGPVLTGTDPLATPPARFYRVRTD